MKIRTITAAAVAAMLVCSPAFASKASFRKHIRMFDRKEAVIDKKIDALQDRYDNRVAKGLDTSKLQAKLDNNNQHLDTLNQKEQDYRDEHPNASK